MRNFAHPGAYPSPKDPRDWLFKNITKTNIEDIDVEGGLDDVPLIIHNQGDLPTCTGEAGAYLQMINQYLETGEMVDLSAMFIYKMNKKLDGLAPDVEGSTAKATVKTLKLKGVCREILYPSTKNSYEKSFPNNPRKTGRIYRNAYQNRIMAYTKCENLDDILIALAENKPVLFTMYLLSDFYKARNGRVPQTVGGRNIGGHAMVALRYNKEESWVKVAQSWGKSSLTDNGYMYIPFSWFKSKVKDDFPMLMDAYTVLDYLPKEAERVPGTLTVDQKLVKILVNGQEVKDMNIPPLLISELGKPVVYADVLEQLLENIIGKKAKVVWDGEEYTLKINI